MQVTWLFVRYKAGENTVLEFSRFGIVTESGVRFFDESLVKLIESDGFKLGVSELNKDRWVYHLPFSNVVGVIYHDWSKTQLKIKELLNAESNDED